MVSVLLPLDKIPCQIPKKMLKGELLGYTFFHVLNTYEKKCLGNKILKNLVESCNSCKLRLTWRFGVEVLVRVEWTG